MAFGAVAWINADVEVQELFVGWGQKIEVFRSLLSQHDFRTACQHMGIVDVGFRNSLEQRYLAYVASNAPTESKEDAYDARRVQDKGREECLDPAQFWMWFCSKVPNPYDFWDALSFLGEGSHPTSAVFNQLGSSFGWSPSEAVGYQQEYQIYLQTLKTASQVEENQSRAPTEKELVTPAAYGAEAVESIPFCEAALAGGEASYFDAISWKFKKPIVST